MKQFFWVNLKREKLDILAQMVNLDKAALFRAENVHSIEVTFHESNQIPTVGCYLQKLKVLNT